MIVKGSSDFKLFQLLNGDLLFSKHAYSIYKVRKPKMTKLGQGDGFRAHNPTQPCLQIMHQIILYTCKKNNISRIMIPVS